ncbi:MAG: hypothetical protein ABI861_01955 [Panacibacter sp.]
MKTKNHTAIKPSQTDKIVEYMQKLEHRLKNVVELLRQVILNTDKFIGEEIFWNAPAFFYKGKWNRLIPKSIKDTLLASTCTKRTV